MWANYFVKLDVRIIINWTGAIVYNLIQIFQNKSMESACTYDKSPFIALQCVSYSMVKT